MKKNIGVIFGGNSVEHEISIITAIQAIENIDKDKYNVIPLYISKDNKFYSNDDFLNIDTFKELDDIEKNYKEKILYKEDNRVLLLNKKKSFFKSKEQIEIDVYFPIVHGTNVEDGKLQGYLHMYGIPVVGTTTKSGVIGQEKSIMKDILKANNFNQTKYIWVKENKRESILELVENELSYPVIVKPNSLGSSIGIFTAKNEHELDSKIDDAFKYDEIVIVEEVLEDFRELNISVVDIDGEIKTSAIEEVNATGEILSYEDKYLNNSKIKGLKNSDNSQGMASLARILPAKIDEDLEKQIEEIAKECYSTLMCRGIIRIDLMIKENKIFINEINNIPGSLSFYLWEEKGILYKELLTLVIEDNIRKSFKERNKKFSFSTNVLKTQGIKTNK